MTRILIAEDERRIASFLEKGLNAKGYTTVVARQGPEALRLASSGAFDLLILDLGLPGMDGFDVLGTLRERDPDLPVIVVTARAGVADTLAGLEQGADVYISKPFAFEELIGRVRGLVAAAAQVEESARVERVSSGVSSAAATDLHTSWELGSGRSLR